MNGNCHFMFGTSIGAMLTLNLDKINDNLILYSDVETGKWIASTIILGSIIGSIFPDIDNPKSNMGQLSKPVSTVIGKLGKYAGRTGARHRGIFHDFSIYILLLIGSYLYFPYALGFIIGCLSHVFLDMFNPMGVPSVFTRKIIHLGSMTSDSKEAKVFSAMCSIMTLVVGFIIKYYN